MEGLKRRPAGLAVALCAAFALLLLPGCVPAEEVGSGGRFGRQLRVFDTFPLHQKLTMAIVNGDIDRAAELLFNAVMSGDGSSIIVGFLHARASPGNEFSIVQTIIRALHMGLDRDDLEKTIRTGSADQPGGDEVVQEISVILDDASPPVVAPPPAPSVHYIQSGSATTFVYGSTTDQYAYAPSGSIPSTPPSTPPPPPPPSIVAPVHSGYTVMVDPVAPVTNILESGTVRACRGGKEEQCCKEYNPYSQGCNCDTRSYCRFKFLHENPVFLRDLRRPGDELWVCYCQFD